jgi:hypothetical protein
VHVNFYEADRGLGLDVKTCYRIYNILMVMSTAAMDELRWQVAGDSSPLLRNGFGFGTNSDSPVFEPALEQFFAGY